MRIIKSKDEFKDFVERFYTTVKKPMCFGIARCNLSRLKTRGLDGFRRYGRRAMSARAIIALNFILLNFKENYGSFAVFATAAESCSVEASDFGGNFAESSHLDSTDTSDNEIIFDITMEFLVNALCLYTPFIIEELEAVEATLATYTLDSRKSHLRSNLLRIFLNFIESCESLNPKNIVHKDVIEATFYAVEKLYKSARFINAIKQKHKNIYLIFELINAFDLERVRRESLKDSKDSGVCRILKERPHKFQFIAFNDDAKTLSLQVAYAKLHALSKGYAPLRSLNLDSIFALFPNLAWSGGEPYELDFLRENEIALRVSGKFPVIDYVDKFPRYLMQVLPQADNIRILDSSKTRFGAFLGAGYTQMPGASYVNFNAGTLGVCMNEGRISSSVIVGEGTDIGGGASILGVLSGGNTTPISIGKNCLLGANSVTGISLGDGCIIDAGVAILAGSKVFIESAEAKKLREINPGVRIFEAGGFGDSLDSDDSSSGISDGSSGSIYKGVMLSGLNGIHFRINSQESKLIAFRSNKEIRLNEELH